MNDPCAPALYDILEAHSFFFSGVLALCGKNEYIVMHRSLYIPVPFDELAIVPEFNTRLNYIKSMYEEARLEERAH
jgi:hypothetical protein